jgi:hypothetical protein
VTRRNLVACALCVAISATPALASKESDALIVMTTVGYMTGAADGCRVAKEMSAALNAGMYIAIDGGNYGKISEARLLYQNARQEGIANAASGKANCATVETKVRALYRSMMK